MATPKPKVYINQAGFATRANVVRQAIVHRLREDLVPPPDVYIGNVTLPGVPIGGWSPWRVNAYLEFIGPYLVHLDGQRSRLRLPDGLVLPSWWDVEPEWFLNQREAAKALGLRAGSVSARLSRGTWPVPARVVVGEHHHGIAQGWDLADLVEYGVNRYLDERGRIADVWRSGPPRRCIDPGFHDARRRARQNRVLQAA
jgi:hypothetical protein